VDTDWLSIQAIQWRLERVKITKDLSVNRDFIVMTDITYWGRGFGVMLFKDSYTGENLY